MKHKVSELEGALLDAAVERCELPPGITSGRRPVPRRFSSDWSIAGPIIERERIDVSPIRVESHVRAGRRWFAAIDSYAKDGQHGQTALIAAMRAYVASKFGDEVDL